MVAAGKSVIVMSPTEWLEVPGLSLPFRVYEVHDHGQCFHVFYCLWQDYSHQQGVGWKADSSWWQLLESVLAGRRNLGQRSLEIVVLGFQDSKRAQAAVQRQLESLIRVD